MIHASSRLPHSLPHSPFPTLPHFLSLKIVESDLVNRFVNCAKYAYIYIYIYTHTHTILLIIIVDLSPSPLLHKHPFI